MIKRSYPYPIATSSDSLEYLLGESGGALMQFPSSAITQFDDANNNSVTNMVVQHTTSGTPGAGIGAGVAFTVETATGNNEIGSTITAVAEAVTPANEDFYLSFSVMSEGTLGERLRIINDACVVVGGGGNIPSLFGETNELQVNGIGDGSNTGVGISSWNAGESGPGLNFTKSRSATKGTHTVVQSGDDIGYIGFGGSDGTDFERGAHIHVEVDGTPGNNDMPGRLMIATTPSGSAAPVERLRVNSDGQVIFTPGSTTPATLATNGNFTLTPTSNTNMRISYRGSDGVTRVANIVLA
jgi:hypothetical protein